MGDTRIGNRRAGRGCAGPVGIAKFLAIGAAVAIGVQAGQRSVPDSIVVLEALAEGIPPETAGVAGAAAEDAAIGYPRGELMHPKGALRGQRQRCGSDHKP
jgi:hypothetical protein